LCGGGYYGVGPRYAGSYASAFGANELVPNLGMLRWRIPGIRSSDCRKPCHSTQTRSLKSISDRISSSGVLRLRTPANTLGFPKSSGRYLLLYCTLLQKRLPMVLLSGESECDGMLRASHRNRSVRAALSATVSYWTMRDHACVDLRSQHVASGAEKRGNLMDRSSRGRNAASLGTKGAGLYRLG
jgi:hypothetical protein